jgi:outer membrane cobalamin receptor
MLAGIVSTTERKPLASARISVIGTALATVADTDGVFRIAALPLGTQSVEVKLLGFSSMLVPVQIEAGKTARLDVTLTASAVSIETVKISGDTLIVPAIQGFLERRERGNGKFFTRADIDRMQARLFTDVLRRVPGMQLQMITGPNNNGIAVRTGRNAEGVQGGRSCPVMFFMNGMPFPMTSDGVINSYINPEEVEGVEVYTGASQIPSQFNSSGYNARCGVVVIWTLNGKESRPGH